MKFKLTHGVHIQDGLPYQTGSVLESPSDLTVVFPNKFEKVADETPVTKPGGIPLVQKSSPQKPQTVKGQLNVDDDEAEIGDGVTGAPSGPVANVAPTAPKPEGKDVTSTFAKAEEEDYQVFKHDGKYFVWDTDTKKCVNVEGCKKAEVDAVVEQALKKG